MEIRDFARTVLETEDLDVKLKALETATAQADRDAALRDMAYLLNDNVEVITAPPQAPA